MTMKVREEERSESKRVNAERQGDERASGTEKGARDDGWC